MLQKLFCFALVAIICVFGLYVEETNEAKQLRIIGGEPAPEGAFPYQVSLQYLGQHLCGGSIMNENWILTAASCLGGVNDTEIKILAGTNDLQSNITQYDTLINVPHELFNLTTNLNDIALIKTASPIQFIGAVAPINISTEDVVNVTSCILSGWGDLSSSGNTTNELHQILLKTIPNEECEEFVGNLTLSDTQLCTQTKEGEGACFGDGGSPLATFGGQIGIVSSWVTCGSGAADVYTRLSRYTDWIENVMATF